MANYNALKWSIFGAFAIGAIINAFYTNGKQNYKVNPVQTAIIARENKNSGLEKVAGETFITDIPEILPETKQSLKPIKEWRLKGLVSESGSEKFRVEVVPDAVVALPPVEEEYDLEGNLVKVPGYLPLNTNARYIGEDMNK